MTSFTLSDGYSLVVFDGQNLIDGMSFDMGGAFFKVLGHLCYIDPGDGVILNNDGSYIGKIGCFEMNFIKQI